MIITMTPKEEEIVAKYFELLGDDRGIALMAAMAAGVQIGRRDRASAEADKPAS
jgi:hypothetical protein